MFAVAMAVCGGVIAAAAVMAVRQRRPLLLGRCVALPVVVYAAGALAGVWPWGQARPLLDWLTHWLGG